MNLGLEAKVAFVTGGTRGIGLACAEALAEEGARVAVISRSAENVEHARIRLSQFSNTQCMALVCDCRDPQALSAAIRLVAETLGKVQVIVGSSGGPAPTTAKDLSSENVGSAMQSNFTPFVTLVNEILPNMTAAGWGRIVFITTSGVAQPIERLAPSNIARAALTAYAKTLAGEVAKLGITVNTVMPGKIDTDRLKEITAKTAGRNGRSVEEQKALDWVAIPAGRYGNAVELAKAVVFLCSEQASYITGARIPVDGGYIKCF